MEESRGIGMYTTVLLSLHILFSISDRNLFFVYLNFPGSTGMLGDWDYCTRFIYIFFRFICTLLIPMSTWLTLFLSRSVL